MYRSRKSLSVRFVWVRETSGLANGMSRGGGVVCWEAFRVKWDTQDGAWRALS